MPPPGMAVVWAGTRAVARSEEVRSRRYFFDWRPVLAEMRQGYFPYTPATLMVYGPREAVRVLGEGGLGGGFSRPAPPGGGGRRAGRAWGVQILCRRPPE